MAEKEQSTQISWKMDGSRLTATIPAINENITLDIADLHESWILFAKGYGVQQHASSFLAKFSFSAPDDMKVALAIAKKSKDETAIAEARKAIREAKVEWLNENAAKIRTELWRQLQTYKEAMPEKRESTRESKAEIEARVKAEVEAKTKEETRARMRAQFEAAGFDEATILGFLAAV